MIEYDKLKIAHELAEKYHNITGDAIVIEHNCCYGCYVNVPCQFIINQVPTTFNSIKDMIQKLTELTHPNYPKPKYIVGQEGYTFFQNEIPEVVRIKIISINIKEEHDNEYSYKCISDCGSNWDYIWEEHIYPSREALIEAQIEYWSKLKLESMAPKFEGDMESFGHPTIAQSTINAQKNIKELGEALFPEINCIHESDGNAHAFKDGDINWNIVMSKCKKCGKFYK